MPVKDILKPQRLKAFKRLELLAHGVVEGFITGLHESPFKGFAVEFAEHRQYVPGDDLKHLDWKLLAKFDRFYVKQYEENTSMRAYLVLDRSGSMGYTSTSYSKLDYGRFICAMLAYLLLQQNDSVGVATCDSKLNTYLPARAAIGHLRHIIQVLEATKPGHGTGLGNVLHSLAALIKRRALIVIVSDFFDNVDEITLALNHFAHKKHEVIVYQVLDRRETEFPFRRLTRFDSVEGPARLLVDPLRLKREYLRQFDLHQKRLRETCHHLHIDFVQLFTDQPFERALAEYLARRLKR